MRSAGTFCFALLLSLAGCSAELQSADDHAPASPEILTFRDSEEIFADAKITAQSSFRSMERIYQEALQKLEAVTTREEERRLLEAYSDVVYQADDAYHPVLKDPFYRTIINRDRMYISGGYLHKVIDNYNIVFTSVENEAELRSIASVDNLDSTRFKVARYHGADTSAPNSKLASCGQDLRKDYFANGSNCRNDRRAWVRAYTSFAMSGYYYTPMVISEAWAERRTGTFCNWKQYQNILHTRNAFFTVTARLNDTSYSFTKTTDDLSDSNPYDGTSDEWQHMIWGDDQTGAKPVGGAIYWSSGAQPSIEFTTIHMESSSQGVGADQPDHWAVIDCQ